MELKNVLSSIPFKSRALFSLESFQNSLPPNFTIVSTDSDYLFFGSVFTGFSNNFPIVLSNVEDAENVIKATEGETGLIVAVGSGKFISFCRVAAKINGFSLFAVFTDLTFAYAFTPVVEYVLNGVLKICNCNLPEKILIDIKKLSTLKKGKLADGFAYASSFLSIAPFVNNELLDCVLSASNTLIVVKNDVFASVVKANILVANVAFHISIYNDAYFVGLILSLISGNNENECFFFASEYVLRLYSLVKNIDFSSVLTFPDYLTPIDELSEITCGKPCEVLSSFEPLSDEEVVSSLAKLKQKIIDINVIAKLLEKLNVLKQAYSSVYNGKKKRLEVKIEQLKKSARLAGVYSKGVLLIILSAGFDSFI